LQTFALYDQRFGGIEPQFKDYKSATFEVLRSHRRDAPALTCLFMLLDCAALIARVLGWMLVQTGQRHRIDWHPQRGLSFLQLGLRELKRLCYQGLLLSPLIPLPKHHPRAAAVSKHKQAHFDVRIEFARVISFSALVSKSFPHH
jgi:hypothetical protein